jgi:hypothetical protein
MSPENDPGYAEAAVRADAGTSRAVIDVTKHQGLASLPGFPSRSAPAPRRASRLGGWPTVAPTFRSFRRSCGSYGELASMTVGPSLPPEG